MEEDSNEILASDPNQPPSKLKKIINKLESVRYWSRKKQLAVFGPSIIVLVGLGWLIFHHSDKPVTAQQVAVAPTTVASPLTGLQVAPDLAARPVTAVMIENSTDARPQSGLQAAGVVFEAVAEGGITRFSALFQEARPQYIGPVRSVRPYYLDWIAPFQPSVVHVGGSQAALQRVRSGMRDLDEFFNPGSYWRIASRPAPHNVYTSFAKLDALNKSKHYRSSTFTPWPRKKDNKLAVPTAKTINLTMSGYYYDVTYHYDATTNTYMRYEANAKHLDIIDASGRHIVQLHPKVVVAMVVPLGSGEADAQGAHYSNYRTLGKGTVYIFQDGGVTRGIWHKASVNSQLAFTDVNGQPIALDAGQAWVTAVSVKTNVSYSPK